jgi:Domain of unknown function (DUF4440)
MVNFRTSLVLRVIPFLLGGVSVLSLPGRLVAQESGGEKVLWNLEHDYWHRVERNDLSAYRSLWHENFLGWPSVSETPVRKDHITDWITSQTTKGFAFKIGEFKPAAIQITGKIGVTYYWVTYAWKDKEGKGESRTIRVTHTWVQDGKDWRIIGGMSMPEPSTPLR